MSKNHVHPLKSLLGGYTDPQYINTKNLVELALSYNCAWLRITPDGPTINNLPILS